MDTTGPSLGKRFEDALVYAANLAFTDSALIQNSKIAALSAFLVRLLVLSGQKDRMLRTRARTIPVA
jgi:hypothetical protein